MTRTPCDEFADRIVDYVDGELPGEEAQVVAGHLVECERCRQTADALRRSLGLAQVLWRDNLAKPGCRVCHAHHHSIRPWNWCARHTLHLAAGILIVTAGSFFVYFHQAPRQPSIAFEEVEWRIVRAGRAAELLAATGIIAQCEGTESIVQQQYRYILAEYADTPAAASIKANQNLKLGGMPND